MKKEYFDLAIKEAKKAYKKDEIPVGCVIVYNHKTISRTHNTREKSNNILGHAEINAIQKASKKLKTWKLDNCELYVTLKPCTMCESIIRQSRIKKVYYLLDKLANKSEYTKTTFEKIDISSDYSVLLSNFFANKRHKNSK